MKLPIVKKEALDRALEVFDLQIRNKSEWEAWERNQAHRYAIQANGLLYPAKKSSLSQNWGQMTTPITLLSAKKKRAQCAL